MSALAELTGTISAVFKHGDKEYSLSMIRLADYGEAESWLQDFPYELAARKIKALGDQATAELKKQILETAEQQSRSASVFSPNASDFKVPLFEFTGLMLWLSIRKKHPEVTRSEAFGMLSFENMELVQSLLERVAGFGSKKEEAGDADKKKAE